MRAILKNAQLILLFVLCAYGLYASFVRGSANAWYYRAKFAVNEWQLAGGIPGKQEYDDTLFAIKKAQLLDPGHPDYAYMLGWIKYWGVGAEYESSEALEEVKRWYLLSTDLRPLWPDTWITLARLNNFLEGYSSETQFYLDRALLTGPFFETVTEGSIEIWLSNWSALSGADRARLFEQFSIASRQAKVFSSVLRFAKEIERENLLCAQLKFNKAYAKQKKSRVFKKYCH